MGYWQLVSCRQVDHIRRWLKHPAAWGGRVGERRSPEERAGGLVGAPDDVQLALDRGQAQQVPQQRLVQVLRASVQHHAQRPVNLHRPGDVCSPSEKQEPEHEQSQHAGLDCRRRIQQDCSTAIRARCGCCHGAQRGARVLQGLSATPRSCGTSGCADEAEDHWAFL